MTDKTSKIPADIKIATVGTVQNGRVQLGINFQDYKMEFNPVVDEAKNLSSFDIRWTITHPLNETSHAIHISKTVFKCNGLMFTKNLFEGEGLENILDLIQISMAHSRLLFMLDNKDVLKGLPRIMWTRQLKQQYLQQLLKFFN